MSEQMLILVLSRFGLDQPGTDPHPRQPAPMLLVRAEKMFASRDWVSEPESSSRPGASCASL